MADPLIPPTPQEEIDALRIAVHNAALSGGVTSYQIGDRSVTRNHQWLVARLEYLLGLQAGAQAGTGRNYVSFGRRT